MWIQFRSGSPLLFLVVSSIVVFVNALEVGKSKITVSIRCVASQGYLRSSRHHYLKSSLTATRHDNKIPLYEIAWEVEDAIPGWVWLRSYHTRGFVRALAPPEKPAWLFSSMDNHPSRAGLFRLEHVNGGWFIYSNHTGGYVNCLEGGLIRGHGYFPYNTQPSTREPTTEFDIVPLNHSAVLESAARPHAAESHAMQSSEGQPVQRTRNQRMRVDSSPKPNGDLGSLLNTYNQPNGDIKAGGCGVCKWSYGEEGYAPPAFSGALSNFLCPSMFRDLADYVWKWPFSHFGENLVKPATADIASKCLPPVPIIYTHAGTHDAVYQWSQKSFRRPYILITGQSDWPVSRSSKILEDKHLVKWYAQNSDVVHPKLVQIPIGLNCFEHAPEMHQSLLLLKAQPPTRDKLVLVNFGNTHPSRTVVWEHLCGKGNKKSFVTCSAKATQNNIKGNPHLVSYYKKVANHKFVVAPRGNGWDTHRLWEALYLGCVPIVESSPLDPLYAQFPVLVVKNWKALDETFLLAQYETLKPAVDGFHFNDKLRRAHWKALIETTRTQALTSILDARPNNSTRKRCWG